MGITVDNAAANTLFAEELQKKIINLNDSTFKFRAKEAQFRCFAHIVNLGVQDIPKFFKNGKSGGEDDNGLDSEEDESDGDNSPTEENMYPISKIRNIFKKLRKSEQWLSKLEICCQVVNISFLTPNVNVSTRCNSTYEMINTAIKLIIEALCANNGEWREFHFCNEE